MNKNYGQEGYKEEIIHSLEDSSSWGADPSSSPHKALTVKKILLPDPMMI